jgi:hypothetical protein
VGGIGHRGALAADRLVPHRDHRPAGLGVCAGLPRDRRPASPGLRRIEARGRELYLNGERLYLRGVLDQGYWPDTGLTAPGPDALRRDMELAREAGFMFVRKHLKFEDPRQLY